jgi:hypothetical protein
VKEGLFTHWNLFFDWANGVSGSGLTQIFASATSRREHFCPSSARFLHLLQMDRIALDSSSIALFLHAPNKTNQEHHQNFWIRDNQQCLATDVLVDLAANRSNAELTKASQGKP